ncbi:serine hydrolase domain-containing protein [Oceanobacillus sp. 1P07AA]|uniref:serine hydrolase domain-containing protein n=1 Tax=Oceanobacillus sp. 1P07AA TaxID=3132293 RepID=UPI0039A5F6A5
MEYLIEFEKKIKKDHIDSVLVQSNNRIIFEYYRNRKMKEKQHKIYSITKSVLSILVGIAVDKGFIKDINTSIVDYFPENKDDAKKDITIKHLLTMTSGLHSPGNNRMIPSKNWVNFVLQQEMIHPPGNEMVYSCGSSHLLSAILQSTTGISTEEFAKKHLFTSLGITNYRWNQDAQGISIGGFGLSMKTSDMLKIGSLYLNKGRWKSKQIVSTRWVEESTFPKVRIDDTSAYAYHWWNMTFGNHTDNIFCASGYEGQYIIVAPEYKLVTVFTSSIKDESSRPLGYFENDILPYIVFR